MSNILETPRNGCALHGALQTVQAVQGLIPIVHSNPGCGVHSNLSSNAGGVGVGVGYGIPGTGAQERHIIFGGASRLREQIKNTAKVFAGDSYIVLNSCASAMVGDDIDAMTREAADQGLPVLDSLIAGFHGDVHYGYEHIVLDLLKQLAEDVSEEEKQENLVNLFGILPAKDLTAQGDLDEITRILEEVGLKVNSFFGVNGGLEQFRTAGKAALSITFSNWGSLPASYLQEKGVPCLSLPAVPMGILEVKELINKIGRYIHLPKEQTESFLEKEKKIFDNYLSVAEPLLEEIRYGGPVAIVADSHRAIQYAGFLRKYLGVPVHTLIYTDYYAESQDKEEKTGKLLRELAVYVYHTQDDKEISEQIKRGGITYLLGSSLEEQNADRLGISYLPISYPVFGRLYLNKTYAGIRGAISFIEDYIASAR